MNIDHAGKNNFDCVRLLAALAVLYSHQVKLTDRGIVAVSSYHDLGKIGVLVFFAMSGYLVAQSWERDPNLWRFMARRMLRIWPGLICVVLLLVFALGPALTALPVRDYFQSPQTWDYLGHIWFVIREQHLPGVFSGHAIERVDGPLWTIPIEAGWYVVLAVLGIMGVLRHRLVLLVLFLAWLARCMCSASMAPKTKASTGSGRWSSGCSSRMALACTISGRRAAAPLVDGIARDRLIRGGPCSAGQWRPRRLGDLPRAQFQTWEGWAL